MPIYEFQCGWCGHTTERYMPISAYKVTHVACEKCDRVANRLFSSCRQRSFESQYVRDIQDQPVFVRNKQDLRNAISEFNESPLAAKQGKVSIYE